MFGLIRRIYRVIHNIIHPKNTLYSILYVYHITARFFFQCSFTVPDTFESDYIKFKLFDLILSVIYGIIYGLDLWFLVLCFKAPRKYSLVLDIGNKITLTFGTSLFLISTIINYHKRYKLWKFFQNLDRVDRELQSFGYIINFRKQQVLYIIYGLSCGFIFFIMCGVVEFGLSNVGEIIDEYFYIYSRMWSTGTIILGVAYFRTTMFFAKCRLKDLNMCFSQYFHLDIRDNFLSVITMDHRYAIPKFATMFELIAKSVKLLSDTHAFKITLLFAFILCYSIFTGLATFRLLKIYNNDEFWFTIGSLLYNLFFLSLLIQTIWISYDIKREVTFNLNVQL